MLRRADGGVATFENRDIKGLLVAEVVVQHALVDAGAVGDVVDPGAFVPPLRELLHRRGQDCRTGGLRVTRIRRACWRGPTAAAGLRPARRRHGLWHCHGPGFRETFMVAIYLTTPTLAAPQKPVDA